jgi:hypothetical protein
VTGASVSAGAELDAWGALDSGVDPLPEELDSGVEEPASLPEEPDSVGEELDSLPEEPASPEAPDPASEPLELCAPVAGEGSCPEEPSVAEEDPSLDRGACAGAVSVEVPVEVPDPARAPLTPAARWASREAVACVAFSVLPGKALAATAVSTPVSVALPAISQRLARLSRRRAASRVREVWWGLTDIYRSGEQGCTAGR